MGLTQPPFVHFHFNATSVHLLGKYSLEESLEAVNEVVVKMPTFSLYSKDKETEISSLENPKIVKKAPPLRGWNVIERNIFKSGATFHSGLRKLALDRRKEIRERLETEKNEPLPSFVFHQSMEDNLKNESNFFLDDSEEERGSQIERSESNNSNHQRFFFISPSTLAISTPGDILKKKMENPISSCPHLDLELDEKMVKQPQELNPSIHNSKDLGEFNRSMSGPRVPTFLEKSIVIGLEESKSKPKIISPDERRQFQTLEKLELDEYIVTNDKHKKRAFRGNSANGLGSIFGENSLKMKKMNWLNICYFQKNRIHFKTKAKRFLKAFTRGNKKKATELIYPKNRNTLLEKPKISMGSVFRRVSKAKMEEPSDTRGPSEETPMNKDTSIGDLANVSGFEVRSKDSIIEGSSSTNAKNKEKNTKIFAKKMTIKTTENTFERSLEVGNISRDTKGLDSFGGFITNHEIPEVYLLDLKGKEKKPMTYEEYSKKMESKWTPESKIDALYYKCGKRDIRKRRDSMNSTFYSFLGRERTAGSKEKTEEKSMRTSHFQREKAKGKKSKEMSKTLFGDLRSWRTKRNSELHDKLQTTFTHTFRLNTSGHEDMKSFEGTFYKETKKKKFRATSNTRCSVNNETKKGSFRSQSHSKDRKASPYLILNLPASSFRGFMSHRNAPESPDAFRIRSTFPVNNQNA